MRLRKIIAFFVLIVLFILPLAVFADIPISIPHDAWEYWVVFQYRDFYYLYSSHNPITYDSSMRSLYFNTYKRYELQDGQWTLTGTFPTQTNYSWPDRIYASNHNIAYKDGSGFFFTPPKVSALYRTMQEVDSGMLLKIILAGLTPLLGLIVLGICLKKGLDFLRNQLQR